LIFLSHIFCLSYRRAAGKAQSKPKIKRRYEFTAGRETGIVDLMNAAPSSDAALASPTQPLSAVEVKDHSA